MAKKMLVLMYNIRKEEDLDCEMTAKCGMKGWARHILHPLIT